MLALDSGQGGADAQGRTPAARVQEEVVKLRVCLGFDVERGGSGRWFGAGDPFVVVERRRDGAQVRLVRRLGAKLLRSTRLQMRSPLCASSFRFESPLLVAVLDWTPILACAPVRTLVSIQEHLRLLSGGWVLSRSPATFEPLATEQRQLPGSCVWSVRLVIIRSLQLSACWLPLVHL